MILKKFNLIQSQYFKNDIIEFSHYCAAYSFEYWQKIAQKIKLYLEKILNTPFIYPFFMFAEAPYRALIFPVGKRTKYWIIYSINEMGLEIILHRFWNAAQNPLKSEVS